MPEKMGFQEYVFAKALIKARKSKHLSQKALAVKIGSTKNTVWCWEHGVRYPNITNMGKLEETLGVKFK